jgi:hypothetical protein
MYEIDTDGMEHLYKAVVTCLSSIQHQSTMEQEDDDDKVRLTVREEVTAVLTRYGDEDELQRILCEYGLDRAYREFHSKLTKTCHFSLLLCVELVLHYIYKHFRLNQIRKLCWYSDNGFTMVCYKPDEK